MQNGVLNRAVSEAAGKGVPGLAVEDGVDSQVSFLSKYQIKISNDCCPPLAFKGLKALPKRCQALSNVPHLTIQHS